MRVVRDISFLVESDEQKSLITGPRCTFLGNTYQHYLFSITLLFISVFLLTWVLYNYFVIQLISTASFRMSRNCFQIFPRNFKMRGKGRPRFSSFPSTLSHTVRRLRFHNKGKRLPSNE